MNICMLHGRNCYGYKGNWHPKILLFPISKKYDRKRQADYVVKWILHSLVSLPWQVLNIIQSLTKLLTFGIVDLDLTLCYNLTFADKWRDEIEEWIYIHE